LTENTARLQKEAKATSCSQILVFGHLAVWQLSSWKVHSPSDISPYASFFFPFGLETWVLQKLTPWK